MKKTTQPTKVTPASRKFLGISTWEIQRQINRMNSAGWAATGRSTKGLKKLTNEMNRRQG